MNEEYINSLEEEIQEQRYEIERLKEEIKGYEQERERVLNIIDERNHKAIEYIEDEIKGGRSEDNLWLMGCYDEDKKILEILKGVDKE